jgi:hypothetical protein
VEVKDGVLPLLPQLLLLLLLHLCVYLPLLLFAPGLQCGLLEVFHRQLR